MTILGREPRESEVSVNTSRLTGDNAQGIAVYRVWLSGLPPKPANRRSNNWKAYHYPRTLWLTGAGRELSAQLGKVPTHERVSVKVTAHIPRAMDQDNLDGYRKCAHDLLQREGMILDDSPAHLTAHPVAVKVVGSAPRRPKKLDDWPKYGQRMMQHLKKLGLMLEIEVLA